MKFDIIGNLIELSTHFFTSYNIIKTNIIKFWNTLPRHYDINGLWNILIQSPYVIQECVVDMKVVENLIYDTIENISKIKDNIENDTNKDVMDNSEKKKNVLIPDFDKTTFFTTTMSIPVSNGCCFPLYNSLFK